ncbi:hypothetical protein Tco_1448734 [Tanacetum coccineum]
MIKILLALMTHRIDDSSRVLLVKLKKVESMSNMYKIYKNEGFVELKIYHVRGLWIWIQFSTSASCLTFQDNECMKRLSQTFKHVTRSFKVDERMICIEINSLPLCAWGSNAFKKIACMFGKFMFFKVEQSAAICTGRVCVATKLHQFVSEKVKAVIHDETFVVQVHELGTWNINILDVSIDSLSSDDENENVSDKVVDQEDVNSEYDLDNIIHDLNKENEHTDVNSADVHESNKKLMKRYSKKDIKGISLIHEMSRLIEVGGSLGFDVRGCHKPLKKMINGIGVHITDQ